MDKVLLDKISKLLVDYYGYSQTHPDEFINYYYTIKFGYLSGLIFKLRYDTLIEEHVPDEYYHRLLKEVRLLKLNNIKDGYKRKNS